MDFWIKVLLAGHVVIALGVIGLVLLQHGKGADMGSASSSLFGATGSANFLSRTTAVLATAFFLSSLGLGYLATNKPKAAGGVMESVKEPPAQSKAPGDVPVPKESAVPEGPGSKKVPN
jgi:preprotein translocase subunit SecG